MGLGQGLGGEKKWGRGGGLVTGGAFEWDQRRRIKK